MALRPIVQYPDPVLLQPTRRVEKIDDEIRKLIQDMWETMYDAPGVGLAANQIGVSLRIAVIDTTGGEEDRSVGRKLVLVNPVMLETKGKLNEDEGCLSFPGFTERVQRHSWARAKALDIDGNEYEVAGDGLLARALSHEIDHLDGIPFINRMSALKRDLIKRKIRKLMKSGEWPEPATAGA
jgi:peptide deformylase